MLNKSLFLIEIQQMMHGFGDNSEPLYESAKIIEDVVLQQMRTIVRKACEISDRRTVAKKNNIISGEDLLFLLRKDKIKLQRLVKYLGKYIKVFELHIYIYHASLLFINTVIFFSELKEFGSSAQKILANDVPQNIVDSADIDSNKKKLPFQSFLEQIDNTGELLENSSTVDEIKQRRRIRAEIAARSMDEIRYIKFSKARRVSFANKNRHKFSDWICLDGNVSINSMSYNVLSSNHIL